MNSPITTGAPYDSVLKVIEVGGANGILDAVNATGGYLEWTTSAPHNLFPYVGISSVDGEVAGNESNGSTVLYRSSQSGRFDSTHLTNAALTTAPAINDGTIYVGASDGGVYAYTAYGNLPQIVPSAIRRADAAKAALRAPVRWTAAARLSTAQSFAWAGQREVALHVDAASATKHSAAAAPLRYHGGAVQTAPRSYAVFWKPARTALERHYIPAVLSALKNSSSRAGGTLAGAFLDTAAFPAQPSDGAIQTEIAKAITLNHWPTGVNAQFLVFTADGMMAHSGGFCSYHSAFALGHDRSKSVVYAVVPYSGAVSACKTASGLTRSGDPAVDAATANLLRVQRELTNDPLLNGWYGSDGGEVGPSF
jgi:hypothetical protein